jgi:Tol biopolymer transport system component
MVTRRKAFEGKTQASLIALIMSFDPPPISTLQPNSGPALDHVVKQCLDKNPDRRWQTARDLMLELQWIAESGSQVGATSALGMRRRRWARLASVGGLLLLLLAGMLAVNYLRNTPPSPQVVRSSLLPPPALSFLPYNFAVSPDGARLAFVAVGPDGRNTLWVRALSTPGAQQINGADGAQFPFWSPDSRRIGFFAEGRLKTAEITGGAVATLCEAQMGRGGSWNRDGTIVFAPSIVGPLYRVPDTGGVPAPVTRLPLQDSPQGHRWPTFLPDGNHFIYFADWSSPKDNPGDGIYVASLDSSHARPVLPEFEGNVAFASGNLLFVRERSLMAQPFDLKRLATTGPAVPIAEQELEKDAGNSQSGFAASDNGVVVFQSAADSPSRMMWVDPSGKELGQLADVGYKDPRLSPDGRLLAVSSDDERNGKHFIRIYDLNRGLSTRLTEGGNDHMPIWSPDGTKITYFAEGPGDASIIEIPADGSGPPQVLLNGGRMLPNDWSPDGHFGFHGFRQRSSCPADLLRRRPLAQTIC